MKHLSQVPKPPSKLRPDIPHDLDAVVMRALAKDPDQRYGSAEEMDADLARVARGVSVSRETEDAMTQVLSGAGIAAAPTMVTRPRGVAPPAPPAYRAPGQYYEEPPRGRSIWPWLLALGLIIAGGDRRLVPLPQDPGSAEPEQARRRARRAAAGAAARGGEDPGSRPDAARLQGVERDRARRAGLRGEPGRRLEGRQGLDGDADRLDRHPTGAGAERRRPGRQPGGARRWRSSASIRTSCAIFSPRPGRHRDRAAAACRRPRAEGDQAFASTSRAAQSRCRCPT